MSRTKIAGKLPHKITATDLFSDRTAPLVQVMVRTHESAQGHWGRGWSIQNALIASMWLKTGDLVEVFLCSEGARCGQINGGLTEGQMGEIFVGTVTAQRDVKVTHRAEMVEA